MSDEELIDGMYKLAMCIATGGSSQVWECVEQSSGRHLAMKLLKQDSPEIKEHKAGLKHEAEVLKSLDHPMIVKFERYSASRDNTYLVMEHFRAPNVKLQLKSDMRSVHVRIRRLLESVCQALSHVHSRGWIHRDVKPDNVLMNKVGEIRLVDFSLSSKEVKGFSKMMGGGRLKAIQGTRTYIAPETIRKQAPTIQTDLYSLGILFFESLTGRTPFQAPTPEELLRRHLRDEPPNASDLNPNVTPEMDRLIQKLLKKKPAERPSSVDEILGEIRRIRIFKEDVTEARSSEEEENSKAMDMLTDVRLDSRADAKLKQMLETNPELAKQFAIEKQNKSAAKKVANEQMIKRAKQTNDREAARTAKSAKNKPAPEPQQAMPPQMMPGMPQPMMMPGQMMPGQMMPGQMMPGQYMPGQMMPGQMMPGQYLPQPGYPQFPPSGPPQFGMPGAMPPGMLPPGMMPPGFPNSGMPMPGMPQGTPQGMPPGAPQGLPPGMAPPVAVPGNPMMSPPGAPGFVPPAPSTIGGPMNPAAVAAPAAPKPAASSPPQVRQAAPPANPPAPAATKPVAPPARPAAAVPKPAPPAAAKPVSPPVNPDELEYMTELPDIL